MDSVRSGPFGAIFRPDNFIFGQTGEKEREKKRERRLSLFLFPHRLLLLLFLFYFPFLTPTSNLI